ncbi:dihydrofolate reductase family protein [Kribbella sp. NPDC056951]|uniref:dihydrofolate reductase family protein n=1 Tax=Kribbella sp. NPDC056951 TaxID=3345978 RepID=UPI00363653A8
MGFPRVVVSVTSSVDARVTVGRRRLLMDAEAGAVWRGLRPAGADDAEAARSALIEELYAPTAILEGSGTFVTVDAGPLELPEAEGVFEDFLPEPPAGHRKWFTVVDGRGRVEWTQQGDGVTNLLLLVARSTPARYLAYLRREGIPYLVAGDERVDLRLALQRMYDVLGVTCVLSEAGGGLNGALLRAGLVDELHLVVLPAAVGGAGVPTVFDGEEGAPVELKLVSAEPTADGVLGLRYEVVK